MIETLEKKGYEKITKTQVEDIFLNLMNLEEEELKEITNDPKSSILVKVVAKQILSND
jgi:hypothetical protein